MNRFGLTILLFSLFHSSFSQVPDSSSLAVLEVIEFRDAVHMYITIGTIDTYQVKKEKLHNEYGWGQTAVNEQLLLLEAKGYTISDFSSFIHPTSGIPRFTYVLRRLQK
ncbi:MAG: hypothetical protein R2811_00690 [Flavobacteriales bacterium]